MSGVGPLSVAKQTLSKPHSASSIYESTPSIEDTRGSLRCGAGIIAIGAMALNAAINGSILATPEACLVVMMALPQGLRRALPTARASTACNLMKRDQITPSVPTLVANVVAARAASVTSAAATSTSRSLLPGAQRGRAVR
jgi:hypothetical protein